MSEDHANQAANLTAGQAGSQAVDFKRLGLNRVAYVKETEVDHELRYVIHTADGTAVTAFPSAALARMAIREHELEPVSIH